MATDDSFDPWYVIFDDWFGATDPWDSFFDATLEEFNGCEE